MEKVYILSRGNSLSSAIAKRLQSEVIKSIDSDINKPYKLDNKVFKTNNKKNNAKFKQINSRK